MGLPKVLGVIALIAVIMCIYNSYNASSKAEANEWSRVFRDAREANNTDLIRQHRSKLDAVTQKRFDSFIQECWRKFSNCPEAFGIGASEDNLEPQKTR